MKTFADFGHAPRLRRSRLPLVAHCFSPLLVTRLFDAGEVYLLCRIEFFPAIARSMILFASIGPSTFDRSHPMSRTLAEFRAPTKALRGNLDDDAA